MWAIIIAGKEALRESLKLGEGGRRRAPGLCFSYPLSLCILSHFAISERPTKPHQAPPPSPSSLTTMSTLVARSPTRREICAVLFLEREDRFHCRLCSASRTKPRNGGYTNLMDHLTRSHETTFMVEYDTLVCQPSNLDVYVRVSVDDHALNVYRWMDWVVMGHHEINFVESRLSRRYSNLQPLGVHSFKRHLEAVEAAVVVRLREYLSRKSVGLLIDAWTEGGTHYAAVIAVTPSLTGEGKSEKSLLCFSPFEDESDMTTSALIELLDYVLDTFQLDLGQLCFFVCDHASVNASLSTRTRVPMIGCASHRLQLAVQQILSPHQELLGRVNHLMGKLNTVKNRHRLRDAGALHVVWNFHTTCMPTSLLTSTSRMLRWAMGP